MTGTLAGRFDVVLCDPPWRFSSNSEARPGRNVRRHYATMTADEIAALPVAEWAADKALLLLWTTSPLLDVAIHTLGAWGFRYKSHVVWDKGRIGTGYWARSSHEPLLIATRGRPYCPRPLFPSSVIQAPRREHSRKPDAVQDIIDARLPDARKLELFARQERAGWTCWGHETAKFEAVA